MQSCSPLPVVAHGQPQMAVELGTRRELSGAEPKSPTTSRILSFPLEARGAGESVARHDSLWRGLTDAAGANQGPLRVSSCAATMVRMLLHLHANAVCSIVKSANLCRTPSSSLHPAVRYLSVALEHPDYRHPRRQHCPRAWLP